MEAGRPMSLKAVVRCVDFERSRDFYTVILGLPVLEEWDQEEGRGVIVATGADGGGGGIEIAAPPTGQPSADPTASEVVGAGRVDLQIRTDSVDRWAERLERRWPFEGPVDRPWGQRYLRVRDPDGVRIAFYEVL